MRTYVILLLVFSCNIKAQNLVLNPSFEEYDHLPCGDVKAGESYCKNWESVGFSYIEYFHKDAPNPNFSVPSNKFGVHWPCSGNAYIGLSMFYWNGDCNFIMGRLKEPLKKRMRYKVTFQVQRSSFPYFEFALFGAKITRDSTLLSPNFNFYQNVIAPEKIRADIENDSLNFISSDSCWTTVEGIYKAKGGEKFIFLGGLFYHDGIVKRIDKFRKIQFKEKQRLKFYQKNQDILRLTTFGTANSICNECDFYFIDDVRVEQIGP